MTYSRLSCLALGLLVLPRLPIAAEREPLQVDEKAEILTAITHHIGNNDKPEWKDFTTVKAEHPSFLKLKFDVTKPIDKLTLEVRSGGVGDAWKVILNHKELGELKKGEAAQAQYFKLPADLVKKAGNSLSIECANVEDDIFVGPIVLHHRPYSEVLRLAKVTVRVRDVDGQGLPCRITVTRLREPKKKDEKEEELVELLAEETNTTALRRGLFYTLDGRAEFNVPAGKYRIYATRGFEYGVASSTIELAPAARERVELTVEHEVDTTGYLAADTHIHTKTYSKHGDASVEERLVTIAGEGVEVAIATDHNHHTDYRPVARKLGARNEFFSVIGNEFTTMLGHFNAFPIEKDAKPAPWTSRSWTKLIQALRATPGVRVIICNHPRRPKSDEEAFNNIDLNPLSGESEKPYGPETLGIDAVEVLNGKGLHEDWGLTFQDWFGLLNRGYRLAAVAGSDSHTVEGIVGQTRTYVRSTVEDVKRLDPQEIADSFLRGRLLLSLGLLADVKVDGRFLVGDLATGLKESMEVEIKVSGPRWSRADSVTLFLNGTPVRKEALPPTSEVVKYQATWRIYTPPHDAHLVVIASGPPITAPYWALAQEKRYSLGATNPIWIDADGDGRFESARDYAARLVREHGRDLSQLQAGLAGYDEAVAFQVASILRHQVQAELQISYERLMDDASRKLDDLLVSPNGVLSERFQKYLKQTPPLEVITRAETKKVELQEKKEREEEEKKRKEEEKKKADEKKKAEDKKKADEKKTAEEKKVAEDKKAAKKDPAPGEKAPEGGKDDAAKADSGKSDAQKNDTVKKDAAKNDADKKDAVKNDTTKFDTAKEEAPKDEP